MAISDTQKVDYLFKKVGYTLSKTDTATAKSPANPVSLGDWPRVSAFEI